MKTSFSDADVTNVPVAPATEALVPTSDSQVVPDSFFSNDAVEGDFDKSDLKIPRLSVVQGVGDLSGELGFTPGQFIFNREVDLGNKDIKISLVRLKKYFVEEIPGPYNRNGPMPALFKSQDDAMRAGFISSAEKKAMGPDHKYFSPVIDADLLIEGKPERVEFPFEFEGVPYALARWSLRSTAYGKVGKGFFSDSQLALRAGLSTKFYMLSTEKVKTNAGHWIHVPKARITGKNSDAFVAWVKENGF